jgi:transposase
MMVFGTDPHKQTHTAVVADELGRKKADKIVRVRRRVPGTDRLGPRPGAGRAEMGSRGRVASGLVRVLLAAGEEVMFIPTRLIAGTRNGGRERGKSDPIDALANARTALCEDV